jgi:hypothetical protein
MCRRRQEDLDIFILKVEVDGFAEGDKRSGLFRGHRAKAPVVTRPSKWLKHTLSHAFMSNYRRSFGRDCSVAANVIDVYVCINYIEDRFIRCFLYLCQDAFTKRRQERIHQQNTLRPDIHADVSSSWPLNHIHVSSNVYRVKLNPRKFRPLCNDIGTIL